MSLRGRRGGICQASVCTMARTFRRVRDVLNRAYSAVTKTTIRVKSDCSSATWMVDASRPVMPAFAAVSCGSVPVADDARPKPYTTTKTYGTRNRKIRKAMAAARTGPPAAASRWTETNATSIERCLGRAASSWSTSSSPLARAVATVSFSLARRDELLGGRDQDRRASPEAAAGWAWAARWGVVGWSRHRRGRSAPMNVHLRRPPIQNVAVTPTANRDGSGDSSRHRASTAFSGSAPPVFWISSAVGVHRTRALGRLSGLLQRAVPGWVHHQRALEDRHGDHARPHR